MWNVDRTSHLVAKCYQQHLQEFDVLLCDLLSHTRSRGGQQPILVTVCFWIRRELSWGGQMNSMKSHSHLNVVSPCCAPIPTPYCSVQYTRIRYSLTPIYRTSDAVFQKYLVAFYWFYFLKVRKPITSELQKETIATTKLYELKSINNFEVISFLISSKYSQDCQIWQCTQASALFWLFWPTFA